jgi:hypothetical protein
LRCFKHRTWNASSERGRTDHNGERRNLSAVRFSHRLTSPPTQARPWALRSRRPAYHLTVTPGHTGELPRRDCGPREQYHWYRNAATRHGASARRDCGAERTRW